MAEEGARAAAARRCSASLLKDRATLSKYRHVRKRGRGSAGDKRQPGVGVGPCFQKLH